MDPLWQASSSQDVSLPIVGIVGIIKFLLKYVDYRLCTYTLIKKKKKVTPPDLASKVQISHKPCPGLLNPVLGWWVII